MWFRILGAGIRLMATIAWAGVASVTTMTAAHAQPPASTLERIRETGRLRIGYGDTAPFSYKTSDGEIVGYSIDLCKELANVLQKDLGLARLDIEYVFRTPRNRIQLLNDGTIDIECNASTNTSERRRSAAFTYSHFYAATRYVSLARHGLKTIEDLRGRSVSVALGTVNVGQINDLGREKKLNLSVIPVDTIKQAFDMVADGQASAFAMDDVLLRALIAQSTHPEVFSLSSELVSRTQPYGFMIRLADGEFKNAVNAALAEIYARPQMQAIYSRWFEQPIRGENINLNQPMSERLRASLAHPVEEVDDPAP